MKRLFILLFSLLLCVVSYADTETINWYVDGTSYATTTCQTGGDIILPNTPYKYGYTFQGWNGYTPIEYLESTGTQYIDTGTKGNINTQYEITFQSTNNNVGSVIFGSRTSATQNSVSSLYSVESDRTLIINDFGDYLVTRQSYNLLTTGSGLEKVTVYNSKSSRSIYLWNEQQTYTSTTTYTQTINTPNNLYIGYASSNMPPIMGNFIGKIFYVKIWDNNALVRDFIPVLDYTGVPCMFDRVTQQFFYNQGTGNFIAGPVINQ